MMIPVVGVVEDFLADLLTLWPFWTGSSSTGTGTQSFLDGDAFLNFLATLGASVYAVRDISISFEYQRPTLMVPFKYQKIRFTTSYQVGLESLEARIVVHQKNEVVYEEDIALLKLDVHLRNISIKELRNQLESTLKEKDDLKLKLEKFETSSNNLAKLIGSQLDANNKTGLGYGNHVNGCEENDSKSVRDEEDSLVKGRFKKSNGNHVVPPPYTGNYMPPTADLSFTGLDDSIYKCKVTESISNEAKVETNVTKSCTHSIEKPKTDRPSAPIIEEWESNSDNDSTISPISDQLKHIPIKIDFVTPVECIECGENEKQAKKPTSFTQNPKCMTKDYSRFGDYKIDTESQKARKGVKSKNSTHKNSKGCSKMAYQEELIPLLKNLVLGKEDASKQGRKNDTNEEFDAAYEEQQQ
uniref:Uncharacterized protein n=1 Tax=Tanacetum cinerariifolium TaxID=118510 RepID=A0A699HKD9_TANCI|nr:hypothetical protein [Tanacetum cinerariifolium]